LSIVAFSAGGAGGAFGAGLLAGLTQDGNRPLPSVVTGVSAGALVSPFAFLGPAWD
jgi:predicted acylesterase/phospholipase RssA